MRDGCSRRRHVEKEGNGWMVGEGFYRLGRAALMVMDARRWARGGEGRKARIGGDATATLRAAADAR